MRVNKFSLRTFLAISKERSNVLLGIIEGALVLLFCLIVGKIHCVVSGVRIRVLGRAADRCIPYLVATSGVIHERNFWSIQEKYISSRVEIFGRGNAPLFCIVK